MVMPMNKEFVMEHKKTVEFKILPSSKDFVKASLSSAVRDRVFWVYVGVILTVLIITEIISRIIPLIQSALPVVGFVGMVLLSLPFIICVVGGSLTYVLSEPSNDKVYFLNSDGYGVRFGKSLNFTEWNRYKQIIETGNYIILRQRNGRYNVIFKRLLSEETVAKIKKILYEAPVKKKLNA